MLNHDNDAGDVVGFSVETMGLSCSTWELMLAGFAGLGPRRRPQSVKS